MVFFSFDGVDGVGKSTQLEQFVQWLTQRGFEVVSCRDPGSTSVGESLRRLLLESDEHAIGPRTEMLMYMSARAQLVDELIRPALKDGKVVVSDRFLLANVVYQAYAGGLDVEMVWQVGRIATDGVQPDLTLLLDMDVHQAAVRRARTPDRLESRGLEYLERVRGGFLTEARRSPERIAIIDASRSIDEVQQQIRTAAEPLLARIEP